MRNAVHPISDAAADYDPVLELVGDARVVLLGEASHGTREFYHERARITRRLVEEKQFSAIAVEADWPDAYRVNRWVRWAGNDRTAIDALGDFRRFPRWMWRNREVLDFVEWLHAYNERRPPRGRVGFYGLDLYSLFGSIEAVIGFLDQVDPEAAQRARYRYSCFEDFGEDTQAYGYAAEFGLTASCEDHAVQQLLELQGQGARLAQEDGALEDVLLRRTKCQAGEECGEVLSHHVSRSNLLVESSRPAHGGDAGSATRASGPPARRQ